MASEQGTSSVARRLRTRRVRARAAGRTIRRATAWLLGPVLAAGVLSPVAVVAGGVAAATVVSAAVASAPAKAAGTCSGTVLVFPDSVNGGSSSAEASEASALGCSVTVFSSSDVSGMTQAQMETWFGGFTAIIIGDPSTSTSCSTTVPADALTYAPDWGPAVKGNAVVLGTAPVLAGSAGKTLLDDALTYAVTGGASGNTGLYASLNCEYSGAAAGTAVPLLASVGGGGFTVTGQSTSCPDSGTPDRLQTATDTAFSGLTAGNLGSWSSPACSAEETVTSFTAGLSGLAYDASATPATFTASTGATGQAYILAGTLPSAGTKALAPSQGGEVPAGTTAGGPNPADSGVTQPAAGDPVNTEDGDFTQSDADFSIPSFGPSLGFTRTYDADSAELEEQTGTPGPMGYGWTDNWATSLTAGRPLQGDIYTLDGLRATGNGGTPTGQPLNAPGAVYVSGGNTYIADTGGNRVEEIAGSAGTQWGLSMTAGHMYTIAGSPAGTSGASGNGTAAPSSLLSQPSAVTLDSSGDLLISDAGNARVVEIPAASGTQWGHISMSANDLYVVAGETGDAGSPSDGSQATSSLLNHPGGLAFGSNGSLYIADSDASSVQEVAAATGSQWGQSMTQGDVYDVAGSSSGASGDSGDGGPATSALLNNQIGIALDSAGDLFVSSYGNSEVQEVPVATGTQWGHIAMTADDIYTVAGNSSGTPGDSGDGGLATSAYLAYPAMIASGNGGQLYIADLGNNRIQEVAATSHTEFGQSMSQGDVYTIAGSSTGTAGFSGDGGTATSALLDEPVGVALDSSGNLYIADSANERIREVSASTADISTIAGSGLTLATNGNGGPATLAALNSPMQEAFDSRGDTYIADAGNNRIQEIASYSHTQYGITMTAGDVYTIAGQADGQAGCQCDGRPATQGYLAHPTGITIDGSGDLYIADAGNNRIQEVPNSTGTQWGQSMTDGYIYTIAGNQYGTAGDSGDGGAAGSALLDDPQGLALDSSGDIYIADTGNNRIQEIAAASGSQWGQSMTAGDIYTVTGSPTGTAGSSGDGGHAGSGLLNAPGGIAVDTAGNLYIGDAGNNRIQEAAIATGSQRGIPMTAGDIYTIAGGTSGTSGDGGPATTAELSHPGSVEVDSSGDVYLADDANNRIQEVASGDGTQWGQSMTSGDIYTVAGSPAGTSGNAGDGSPADSALMADTQSISLDPEGDLYVTDNTNDTVREVASAIPAAIPPAPGQTSSLAIAPSGTAPGGLTITQPGGAQVTFWAQSGGTCPTEYVTAGSYCILPQDQGAALTYTSGTYAFTPGPGGITYSYNTAGQLTAETDTAGNELTLTYSSPAPGGTVTGNGTCPSTSASCETITAASGRALILGWNGAGDSGQVTSVTDPMNRTWTYAYNTAGQLTSATDPMTIKTSYTYGQGSTGNPLLASDLLTITGPNAQPGGPDAGDNTVNVYNAAGQVTQQTDPMGWTTTFSYCASAASGDCLNAATGTGLVSVTDPDGNTTVYDYQQGTLAAQTDMTSTSITSQQDSVPDTTAGGTSGGTLLDTASVDGDGNTTTSSYNADGNPTSSTAPGANGTPATTTNAYTSTLQDTDCSGTAEASGTDTCNDGASPPAPVTPGGTITPPASAPPLGVTYTLYDTDGNQLYATTGVYSPAGSYEYSQTTYQLFKGNTITLGSTNITCTYTPPSASLPCATINADGIVTQLEYDAQGDQELSATPDGNSGGQLATTTSTYNADGEELTKVAPDGNISGANAGNYTTTTAWNADGQQTSVTQGNGSGYTDTPRAISYTYDGDGNQTKVKDARGYTTTTVFNADDQATFATNPDSDSVLVCYDGDGNTAQTVPPVGVAAGSLTAASCPTSYPAGYTDRLTSDSTVSTFNAMAKMTSQTTPAPAGQSGYETSTYTYDGNGNVLTTTAPPTSNTNGAPDQVTVNTYNSTGQLASQTAGSGTSAASTVSYCYDPDGDKTSAVYADGNTSGTAACSTSSPWTVTATGQAKYQTTYSYDSICELVSTVTPANTASSTPTTTATYDAAGNMLTRTDPDGVKTTWTYTPLNQVATITYSGSSAHSVSYSYDASGNQTGMTDATGTSSTMYDSFGELTSAENGASQTVGYGYNADGEVTGITYPLPSTATWATTDTVTYGYDDGDELTSVTDFNGHQISIGNTADGLPNSVGLGSSGDTTATTYDATGSPLVISLKNSSSTLQSFTYSDAPSGTALSETDTPSSSDSPADYTYDAQSRVTSMTPGSGTTRDYGFDASANLTLLPTGATGTYNYADQLTSSVLSGTTTDYTYNADGEQLASTQGSTTESSGTWNGAGQLATYDNAEADMTAASYNGNGVRASTTITPSGKSAVSQGYVWNTIPQVPELLMDGTNAYVYDGGIAPVEQVSLSAGTLTYLVTDSLGSVRGTVNSSGTLTGTTSYDAWGSSEAAGGLTAATPFGYAGGYTDPDGLIYLLNRYYQPSTGQFISVDPKIAQTLQPYQYADGNPVMNSDPTGDWADWSWNCGIIRCTFYVSKDYTRTLYGEYSDHELAGPALVAIVLLALCTVALEGDGFAIAACAAFIGITILNFIDMLKDAAVRRWCVAEVTTKPLPVLTPLGEAAIPIPLYPEYTDSSYCKGAY
jgi:trimeric autotransporter adhesin